MYFSALCKLRLASAFEFACQVLVEAILFILVIITKQNGYDCVISNILKAKQQTRVQDTKMRTTWVLGFLEMTRSVQELVSFWGSVDSSEVIYYLKSKME